MSAVCPAAGIGFMPMPAVFFSVCAGKMTKYEKNVISNNNLIRYIAKKLPDPKRQAAGHV